MAAASSLPKPDVIGASWVTIHFQVFVTELNTVSLSHDRTLMRSTTSHEMPSFSSVNLPQHVHLRALADQRHVQAFYDNVSFPQR